MKLEKNYYIVLASCTLHNFLRRHAKSTYVPTNPIDMEDLDAGELINGDWRQQEILDRLQPGSSKNVSEEAKKCREEYKNCFLDKGRVSWQERFAKYE
jgi:hypothetical protein